jgi:carbamoyltransferase
MNILGISAFYHDASAALISDGQIVASSAEERFTRQKHDPSFPIQAIEFCLQEAGLKGHELDLVAFHEDVAVKLTRTLTTAMSRFPLSLPTFIKTGEDAVLSSMRLRHEIHRHLGVDPQKIVMVPHHMSHAALAFITSPFQEAAVMTIDAVGEWACSAIYKARKSSSGLFIEPVDLSPFPHSLGLFYSAFTAFLGFKVNDGECSTMALATFGEPRFVNQLKEVLRIHTDGTHELDTTWFDFSTNEKLPITSKFTQVFGAPRPISDKMPFSIHDPTAIISSDHQRFADIACSVQQVFEEAVLAYGKRACSLVPVPQLCYSGGGALNCVANSALANSGIFESVYIPPDPGDGGGALGAALYVSSLKGDIVDVSQSFHCYFGMAAMGKDLDQLYPFLEPHHWKYFTTCSQKILTKEALKFYSFSTPELLIKWTAKKIAEKKIVGWCQGAAENGPRALGNRSILVRPDNKQLAARLSKKVKLRASFRPYAVALTETEFVRAFEPQSQSDDLSRWMQGVYKVKSVYRDKLKSAMHIDFTTRAQKVTEADNSLFTSLIKELGHLTGCEALLNTSFNESGHPLVNSANDALMFFARTDLDILVVGQSALEKIYEEN